MLIEEMNVTVINGIVYENSFLLREKIKRIKRSRYKSEELFFIDILGKIKPIELSDGTTYWYIDNICYFLHYKNGFFLEVSADSVYKVFMDKYGIYGLDIMENIIYKIISEYKPKWKGLKLTPSYLKVYDR